MYNTDGKLHLQWRNPTLYDGIVQENKTADVPR